MRITNGPDGRPLQTLLIVAFERGSGRVRGTYAHSFTGAADDATMRRAAQRLERDVIQSAGSHVDLDTVHVDAGHLGDRVIDRVDPSTREVVMRPRARARAAGR
jgi:hypothetical protein